MKFIYVLPEWEGTTSDSRILKDALSRVDPLKIPEELKARHTSKLSQYNHTVATIFVEYASAIVYRTGLKIYIGSSMKLIIQTWMMQWCGA
ncbi:uncharacterized protein [Cicer arietinum]|uniref:Uncharacterized protein LOC113787222 isoform X2 n=1 Tax=Cicer arietinum TaxID=3827 RepID=A0A3Q7Y2H4_CICAR|nr:uncharacterized protein LOC113787222 isoform X2 [Cicer arietinum]